MPIWSAKIRDAIGDDAANPRHIRTVHRFGYAFRDAEPPEKTGRSAGRGTDTAFHLKWLGGRVTLEEGEHLLGRDPDAEIYVNSAGVSRRHARIRIAAGRATIEDLDSKNGTFLGDRRIVGLTVLENGDVIGVGSVKVAARDRSGADFDEDGTAVRRSNDHINRRHVEVRLIPGSRVPSGMKHA